MGTSVIYIRLTALLLQQHVDIDFSPPKNDEVAWKVDFSKRGNFSDTVTYQGAEWPLARSLEVYNIGSSRFGAMVIASGLVVKLGDKAVVGDAGMMMKPYHFNKWYWEKDATDKKLQTLVKGIRRRSNKQWQCDDTKSYFSFIQIHQEYFQHITFDTLPKIPLMCDYLTNNAEQNKSIIILVKSSLQQHLIQEICPTLTNDRFEIFGNKLFVSSCHVYVPVWKQHSPINDDPLNMGMTQREVMEPLGRANRFVTTTTTSNYNKTVVYLSRGTSGHRSVKNEARILDIIRNLGFKVEVPNLQNNWRVDRQILETADIIAAPHGGALGNIIFAKSGTKVVEFLPLVKLRKQEENSRPCYFGLALALGLDYEAVEPKSFGFDQPMVMDEDRVKKLFTTMI